MLEFEVLVLLTDTPLAQGQELLALGESANGYCPFLESDRHFKSAPERLVTRVGQGDEDWPLTGPFARPGPRILDQGGEITK